jgi:SpoVK/Ycf46/Vps4 family AAA+-type ATPase
MKYEEERDSWTKTFDPSHAVREIEPVCPPYPWDRYIAEPFVKRQLQSVCDVASQSTSSGSVLASLQARIHSITRGMSTFPPKTSHRVVLVHGPPGNGKTHAVRTMSCAVATSSVKVYQVDLTSIKSTWLGQAEHQMKQVLNYVGELENAIVFIDEIDSIMGEFNRSNVHNASLLTAVLQWINGIETQATRNLTIVCATNFMQQCDAVFLSRCTLKIEIPPPSQQLRHQWWSRNAQHLDSAEINKLSSFPVDSFRALGANCNGSRRDFRHSFGLPALLGGLSPPMPASWPRA